MRLLFSVRRACKMFSILRGWGIAPGHFSPLNTRPRCYEEWRRLSFCSSAGSRLDVSRRGERPRSCEKEFFPIMSAPLVVGEITKNTDLKKVLLERHPLLWPFVRSST